MKISIKLIFLLTLTNNSINTKSFATICRSVYRNFKAVPCSNQSLQKKFKKIQNELSINPKIPLFETENFKTNRLQNAIACYLPYQQAIIINNQEWPYLSKIEQEQTLYHELRHHQQYTNPLSSSILATAIKYYNLSIHQANEWDADQFGMIHAAKHCRKCYQELRKSMYTRNPKTHKGYFNQGDCTDLMRYMCKNHKPCKRHSK